MDILFCMKCYTFGLHFVTVLVYTKQVVDNEVFLAYEGEQILKVFQEFLQIGKYNLLNAKNVCINKIVNIPPSRKSMTLLTTAIKLIEE